ncbi:MAG TPA: Arm DNA-binding domain-containing protein [Hyphomonadaceae bacterium]|nr:Arm DNA-binding domain-containing protein [Hyphomonadaceae bacterium]HPN04634.1 Arm DNA-binding domain-containing protein [Hyphomonadaceae bacterium]
MALNDALIRNAKPKERDYKLFDNEGLYLQVTTGGGRLWRLKYFFAGKEKALALGRYPDINLAEARRKRNAAREALDEGRDPGAERAASKRATQEASEHLFREVAVEWHEAQSGR